MKISKALWLLSPTLWVAEKAVSQELCPGLVPEDDPEDPIYIAGIFDTATHDWNWGEELFNFTIQGIQNGWFDFLPTIFLPNITYSVINVTCGETNAARAYWNLRTRNNGRPPHGIVGARCSGASISLARIAGLENVPQISPSSSAAKLTNPEEFPLFSRLVAPGDARGEVGALVALLRSFGWSRVTIIATDTPFANSLTKEFRKAWEGDHDDITGTKWKGVVFYPNVIGLNLDGSVDEGSVRQALDEVPTDPKSKFRIFLLVAHADDASHILKIAKKMNFQPDAYWVGPSSWMGRLSADANLSNLPKNAGYVGIIPFQNDDNVYVSFFLELQKWQALQKKTIWSELPIFGSQLVDSIIALLASISGVATTDRRNGFAIVEYLRRLDFAGVSGQVHFTPEGDLKDPQFTILHLRDQPNGEVGWSTVGTIGNEIGSETISLEKIWEEAPSDSYRVPWITWAIGILFIFMLLFLVLAVKYWRSRKSKQSIKAELDVFRDSVVGMRTAENNYLPMVGRDDDNVEHPKGTLTVQPTAKVQWCWKDTPHVMDQRDAEKLVGDPAHCWIKYNTDSNYKLEAAFQKQGRQANFSPMPGYVLDFTTMTLTQTATGFQRDVQRVVECASQQDHGPKTIDLKDAQVGETLPSDIRKEPQMVLVKGDVVQISKQRSDGWAFGTKLYHADEAVARELVAYVSKQATEDEANVFVDTGWFQLDATCMPSADDLAALQKNIGDTGALEAPSHWAPVVDPSVAQQHAVKKGDPEYDAVVNSFISTLSNRAVKIVKVERVQNLGMWQSYVVKRQTICYRETGLSGRDITTANAGAIQQKAIERSERRWLWHGTKLEVMDKILQQGFNRSFCGKNATAYGKGVYFARDASYSSDITYAEPDSNGDQYIMACRVVVGEYCPGTMDALTPNVRDAKSQSLYDSTVGLLFGDTMSNPSIYVTYHDAQAFPEYLIKFKQ